MKGLLFSILISIFAICFFLNEFKWKKLNPNGFVKSDTEVSRIMKASKAIEKTQRMHSATKNIEDYSFLEINIKTEGE